jgi:hypothetical protein
MHTTTNDTHLMLMLLRTYHAGILAFAGDVEGKPV